VEHVRAHRQRHVRPVVHRQQRSVAGARLGQHLQRRDLSRGFQCPGLVAQLDDVDAARQGRVGEGCQVAAGRAGVRAQVQARAVEAGADLVTGEGGHSGDRTSRARVDVSAREPEARAERELPLRPWNLIRVMPAQGA